MVSRGSQSIAQSSLDEAQARVGVNGARMALVSAGVIELLPVTGSAIEINGIIVLESSIVNLNIATNMLTADGGDSAAAPAVSTCHYAYVSNGSVAFLPLTLALSATAPTVVSGIPYLGAAGVPLNWRYMGRVGIDAGGAFNDSTSSRLISNLVNKRPLAIRLQPGYNNNNAATTFALNSANWAALNAGAADSAAFIFDGSDFAADPDAYPAALFCMGVTVTAAGAAVNEFGMAIDVSTDCGICATVAASAGNVTVQVTWQPGPLADGARSIRMVGRTGALATTIAADRARNGATADPVATYLYGVVYQ
jgi:hypothetical protein